MKIVEDRQGRTIVGGEEYYAIVSEDIMFFDTEKNEYPDPPAWMVEIYKKGATEQIDYESGFCSREEAVDSAEGEISRKEAMQQ